MPTNIKIKNSVTATNVPSSLQQGEVAINITDKKVWVGNAATTPVLLLGSGADGTFTNLTVSGIGSFADGTVSAPSITNIGDTNTGIFFPAADTIAFTEGGAEVARFDANGSLGIGVTNPSANGQLAVQSPSGGINYGLIGRSSDGYGRFQAWDRSATTATGSLAFFENGTIGFNRSNTGTLVENMRIDDSGNIQINNTAQFGSGKVSVKYVPGTTTGIAFLPTTDDSSPSPLNFLNAAGSSVGSVTTTDSATAYNTGPSDYRLKENIAPMTGALNKLSQLKPVTYKWKSDGSNGQGFIAHELQEIMPEAVNGAKDAVDKNGEPEYQSIFPAPVQMIATLVAAIQEIKAELDSVKVELSALKA